MGRKKLSFIRKPRSLHVELQYPRKAGKKHMATQRQYREEERSRTNSHTQTENRIATGLGWFSIGLGLTEIVAPRTVAKLIGMRDEARTSTVLRLYGMREVAAGIGILSQANPCAWLWA